MGSKGHTRRGVLVALGAGSAAVAIATIPGERRESLRAFANRGATETAPWWLLQPLVAGASLGLGWTLAGLSPVERGSSVITLARGEERARVHLCARQGPPAGLAATALFDLVLMDGGRGDSPTDEGLGRVILGLATRIRRNEVRAGSDLSGLDRLFSHEERVTAFGPEEIG